jgi:uncharacterized protein YndB with AHSA1/START domain
MTTTYSTTINAPRSVVWDVLFGDESYRKWSAAFCEGSHAVSDWKEGSKILFLDANGSGMLSKIAEKRPNEFMSFAMQGEVKDGQEIIKPEFEGASENYRLTSEGDTTRLDVDFAGWTVPQNMLEYFAKTWPIALAKVKELAEQQ